LAVAPPPSVRLGGGGDGNLRRGSCRRVEMGLPFVPSPCAVCSPPLLIGCGSGGREPAFIVRVGTHASTEGVGRTTPCTCMRGCEREGRTRPFAILRASPGPKMAGVTSDLGRAEDKARSR
jgi:hypothetical protein